MWQLSVAQGKFSLLEALPLTHYQGTHSCQV